jgi:UDP-3-O-[3-hydroxymyristoyl] glucosamine N-acyltransferase
MSHKSFTLAELAEHLDAKLVGDSQKRILGVSDLKTATQDEATFLSNPRYVALLKETQAGVILITKDIQPPLGKNYLIIDNPSAGFQKIVEYFFSAEDHTLTSFTGIHPTAVLHSKIRLAEDVEIGPNTVIDEGVQIGNGSKISAGCYIGRDTIIGKNCLIHPNVTIRERIRIGNRVIIQSGVVIGSCGFGYITDPKTGKHLKLEQLGDVIIEDDVEIGANTTIDRARFKSTIIGQGSKIDNLVMIAHGVRVGPNNLFVAQSGIAGSSSTGTQVILAGQTGVVGHVELGDGVVVAAKSGVSKSLKKRGYYSGIPALPVEEYNRMSAKLRKIEDYEKRIRELERKLVELSEIQKLPS